MEVERMIQIKMFYFRLASASEISAKVNDWLSKNRDAIDVIDIKYATYCTPHGAYSECDSIMIIYRTSKGETLND